jgi:aspartate-semialdehyde dehydrogenase
MGEADGKIVLLAGASGLTGSRTLDVLLDAPDITRVLAVSRRPLGREHPRLANRILQFPQLETQLKGTVAEAALCCLGTTIRQAA